MDFKKEAESLSDYFGWNVDSEQNRVVEDIATKYYNAGLEAAAKVADDMKDVRLIILGINAITTADKATKTTIAEEIRRLKENE
jgi:hypothetical protein